MITQPMDHPQRFQSIKPLIKMTGKHLVGFLVDTQKKDLQLLKFMGFGY